MSSKIRIQKFWAWCGASFIAKTTTTQYCPDKYCSKLAYKARKREEKHHAPLVVPTSKPEREVSKPSKPSPDVLTVREAAEYLRCSVRTVYRLVQTGKL
jgi:hypothetical protein